jgi:hypothetical protein
MEPLSSAAIGIATIILTKTFEKTGQNLGDVLSNRVGQLIKLVRGKNLQKTIAIDEANQPANYSEAVLELEAAEKIDPELAEATGALKNAIESDPDLLKKVQSTANAVKSDPSIIHNYGMLAEKIGVVVQGGTATFGDINM